MRIMLAHGMLTAQALYTHDALQHTSDLREYRREALQLGERSQQDSADGYDPFEGLDSALIDAAIDAVIPRITIDLKDFVEPEKDFTETEVSGPGIGCKIKFSYRIMSVEGEVVLDRVPDTLGGGGKHAISWSLANGSGVVEIKGDPSNKNIRCLGGFYVPTVQSEVEANITAAGTVDFTLGRLSSCTPMDALNVHVKEFHLEKHVITEEWVAGKIDNAFKDRVDKKLSEGLQKEINKELRTTDLIAMANEQMIAELVAQPGIGLIWSGCGRTKS